MNGRIDDPVDASFEGWPDESEDLGRTVGELALSFSALIFGPAQVLNILKDRFDASTRKARVFYLFEGMRIKLDRLESETRSKFNELESQSSDLRDAMKLLHSEAEAPRFKDAVAVACEEAARAIDLHKVDQFASLFFGSLTASQWADPEQNVATMIRDVAQLGDVDIRVLQLLYQVFAQAIVEHPNLNDPNPFTQRMDGCQMTIPAEQRRSNEDNRSIYEPANRNVNQA